MVRIYSPGFEVSIAGPCLSVQGDRAGGPQHRRRRGNHAAHTRIQRTTFHWYIKCFINRDLGWIFYLHARCVGFLK